MADDQKAGPSAPPLPPARASSPSPSLATAAADKCRRDEWSEGGVVSLLKAYESKWRLRNRAKLKGADWEEIARLVSARSAGSRAAKTPSQCKNKVESMKKRYKAESAAAAAATGGHLHERGSAWQFYGRMEVLLKGAAGDGAANAGFCSPSAASPKPVDGDPRVPESRKVEVDLEADMQAGNMIDCGDGSNTLPDINHDTKNAAVPSNDDDGKKGQDSGGDSDTAAATRRLRRTTNKRRRRRSRSRSSSGVGREVAESIRVLASSMLQIEQGRMEMCRELERMRVEAEIKRGQMELRRVEIIADAQLRIARIFSRAAAGGNRRRSRTPLRSVSERSTTAASGGEDS